MSLSAHDYRKEIEDFITDGYLVVPKTGPSTGGRVTAEFKIPFPPSSKPSYLDLAKRKILGTTHARSLLLKEGNIYRSQGDVLEVQGMKIFPTPQNGVTYVEEITVVVRSAGDEVQTLSIPMPFMTFTGLTKNKLIPFWATVRYLKHIELLYEKEDASSSKSTPGAFGKVAASNCPVELAETKDALDRLKAEVLLGTVDESLLFPLSLHVDAATNDVILQTKVRGKTIQMKFAVGDTVETLVPEYPQGTLRLTEPMPNTITNPASAMSPPVALKSVKCNIMSIDRAGMRMRVSHNVSSTFKSTWIPLKENLYFWRYIQLHDKYLGVLGVKKSLKRSLRRGGYVYRGDTRRRRHR